MACRVDVDQMLSEIPSPLFFEWRAYDQIDPIGEERADLRNAILCATVVNSRPFRGKDSMPARVEEFMPYLDPEERRAIKMKRIMDAFMAVSQEPKSGELVDKKGKPLKR